jgi:hypothetical protein
MIFLAMAAKHLFYLIAGKRSGVLVVVDIALKAATLTLFHLALTKRESGLKGSLSIWLRVSFLQKTPGLK